MSRVRVFGELIDGEALFEVPSDKSGEVVMWLERLFDEHALPKSLLEATAIVVERALFNNIQKAEIATAKRILEPNLMEAPGLEVYDEYATDPDPEAVRRANTSLKSKLASAPDTKQRDKTQGGNNA